MNQLGDAESTRVCVVTVTYGNRFRLLKQMIDRALANDVWKIIIVDNGSAEESSKSIQKMGIDSNGRVDVVKLPDNRGSAGGYKAGLKYAVKCSDCEYIWLLDDDNLPLKGALAELRYYHARSSGLAPTNSLVLASMREDWRHHREIVDGVPPFEAFPRRSSFQWFHLLDLPRSFRKLLSLKNTAKTKVAMTSPIEIPFAPYGGLFFHKSAISRLGYPDERFYVYGDDTEYTYRFIERGGKLFLIPSSKIVDVESVWHLSAKHRTLFSILLTADSDFRVYYATRNQCYFDSHCWSTSHLTYTLNKWAFFSILFLFTIRYRKWRRYALIALAVRDGEQGKLGRARGFENPTMEDALQ